jgi:hypothetical protein
MTWFTRLRNWQTDNTNGIGIRADYHDNEDDNFATALNSCLNIGGLNSPTSNISMGNFKLTNVALGTSASDYARLDQAQTRVIAYAADSVGTDSYAITLSPSISAYAPGQQFVFAAGTANTGAATLNINGLGAKTIKKDKDADLNDGDIAQNQMITVIYDGTNFQMQTPAHGQMNQTLSAIYAADGGGSDSYSISLTPAISSYANGLMVNFKANTANTGASSININGLGAKTIKKDSGLDLETGDIKSSQIIQVIYDGTNFQLLSPKSYSLAQNCSAIYAADSQASDTYVVTLSPVPTVYTNGMVVNFKANTLNTGAATLNVNSLGAITIKKFGTTNDLATGDILANQIISVIYDGTNFQLLSAVDDIVNLTTDSTPDRTADFVKTWDASATTYKKILLSSIPGRILQIVNATTTTEASTTTQIPVDDTIPQNTEGSQIISASITPLNASSTLYIEFLGFFSMSGGTYGTSALFQDSTANSLNATCVVPGTSGSQIMALNHTMTSGTTSSTTFKIRMGPGAAQTMYFLQLSTGPLYGGVNIGIMRIIEYI